MTHSAFTYSPPHFIDTAPLGARYHLLMATMMGFIAAGLHDDVLRVSLKVLRLTRVFIRADRHNRVLRRKLEMLANPVWRMRVLRELGGMRRLKLWDAARLRAKAGTAGRKKRDNPEHPAWRMTADRRVESERLKARARLCAKACAPANIVRDRVRMDFDGMFRLPPLPRGSQGARGPQGERQVRVYTAADISDYRYNAIPFAPVTGLGPAAVWPLEFYAAMLVDAEKSTESTAPSLSWPDVIGPSMVETSDKERLNGSARITAPWITRTCRVMTEKRDIDEPVKKRDFMPLPVFMGRKAYRALFENPI